MKYHDSLTADDFDALLGLFSDDRNLAGEKYEQIRRGLVRYFDFKGCPDSEALADETMNRVALKSDTFDSSRNTNITSYFYGFASNVLLEYRRVAKRNVSIADAEHTLSAVDLWADPSGDDMECLHKCMSRLPPSERGLIVEYYTCERQDRSATRKSMCERDKCTAAALHTKIFRIKGVLRNCVEECLAVL